MQERAATAPKCCWIKQAEKKVNTWKESRGASGRVGVLSIQTTAGRAGKLTQGQQRQHGVRKKHPPRARQGMGQVFHQPKELGASPGKRGLHGPKGDTFYSLCGKFQPYLISWGSCKIVTQRKGPNRKELEEKCLSSGSRHGCARS